MKASHVDVALEFQAEANISDWLQRELGMERILHDQMLEKRHEDLLRRLKYLICAGQMENKAAPVEPEVRPPVSGPAKDLILPPGTIPIPIFSSSEHVQSKPKNGQTDLPRSGTASTFSSFKHVQSKPSNGQAVLSRSGSSSTALTKRTVKAVLDEDTMGPVHTISMSRLSLAQKFTEYGLDIISAIVILLYVALIAIKTQYKGIELAYSLSPYVAQFRDRRPPEQVWPHAQETFDVSEWCFIFFFCAELALRVTFKIRLTNDRCWNFIDAGIILSFFIEKMIPLGAGLTLEPTVMRMLRLLKLMRLLKLVRYVQSFHALHLITKSIASTVAVLNYSMAVILMLLVFMAVLQANWLSSFIGDMNQDPEIRRQVFMKWGSFWRAFLSMFEITLEGWGPHCWFLVNNVGEAWGCFFVVWKCAVGFAVIEVIKAVFIQHTFKIASQDEDIMIQEKMKASETTLKHLDNLFKKLDVDGNGFFTMEDLEEALEDARVISWFAALEIEISEVPSLFRMIDKNGDGKVHKDEFLNMLRGGVSRFDILQVMGECQAIRATLRGMVPEVESSSCEPLLHQRSLRTKSPRWHQAM